MAEQARQPSPEELDRIVNRGVAEIIPRQEFIDRLNAGRPLRLKMGFDPSAPDLHLGHVVGLRKLRQLQELGHTVVVIVGDWTARIGDPSGRSETRPMLSAEQVAENAETYMRQFFSVVDRDRAEVRYQSEWFDEFTLATVMRLSAEFTVNQFLHRDDFGTRYAAGNPIGVVELLYPLLQAYDSVAVEADVEFGGTDQRFNLLVGRDLQEKRGQRAQDVFLVPILPGTDGARRMGKSLGNSIDIEGTARHMFFEIMRLPDSVVPLYYELLTDLNGAAIEEIRSAFQSSSSGLMDLKKSLASQLTTVFHSALAANAAQGEFESEVQRREEPSEVREFAVTPTTPSVIEYGAGEVTVSTARFLREAGLAASAAEAVRLMEHAHVEIGGSQLPPTGEIKARVITIPWGSIVKVGKRKFIRVVKG